MPAVLGLVMAVLLSACSSRTESGEASAEPTVPTNPGPPWTSGVWLGGATDSTPFADFGEWRGTPADTLTTYPAYETWEQLSESDWHVATFEGFEGQLVYGLPLLPSDEPATLREVADGEQDAVWEAVAGHLIDNDRPDSFVRIGLEANGVWFPWGATAATAEDFKDAFRHVAEILTEAEPELRIVFDISCSVALQGDETDDRMASLEQLYPGDDVVDIVGCDHYDSFTAIAKDEAAWEETIQPSTGPGLVDVVEFARERGKGFAVPEWGLTTPDSEGGGDNPFFIEKMYEFFAEHEDVLVFENYFDEPDPYLGSSLFLEPQNPRSAEVYRALWSGRQTDDAG